MTPNNKPWWQSKTMQINLLASALLLVEANLGVLQTVLPVNVYAVAAFVLPIVNLVLRAVTTNGISLRSTQ